MPLFRDASVRTKLILTTLLGSGAGLLLVGAAITCYDLMTLRKTLVRKLAIQADIVGANSLSALLFSDPKSAEVTLAALQAEPRIVAAGLYGADRKLFAAYRRDSDERGDLPQEGAEDTGSQHRLLDDRLVLSRGLVFDQKPIGAVVLVSDLEEISASMTRDVLIFASVLLVSLALALVVSSRLQRHISEPILRLAGIARRVSQEKDYSVRASGESRDEIGALVAAFNGMLDAIRQQQTELRAAHTGLEQRVAQRTAQLQAANSELEAFSYSVSHDLRAPIRHIAGFAELLESTGKGLDDAGRRYLKKISEATHRMGQLIDDLLVFSRMGRAEMRTEDVRLADLLAEVIKEAQPDLKGRPIEWRIGTLPQVRGDPAMLRLVFANLVSNAVKYTGKRPDPRIEIGAQAADGEEIVYVRDNGVGFDSAYASKLFGVFQRLHRADEFEGTGIGLANVRRIVIRHGGRTWAEGEPGRGAAFYFSLPKNQGVAA
jgi:signal transduction histidine kinase